MSEMNTGMTKMKTQTTQNTATATATTTTTKTTATTNAARAKGALRRTAAVLAGAAAATATAVALSLTAPSAAAADTGPASAQAKDVYVWATNVRLHVEPYVNSPSPTTVSQETLVGLCQKQGDTVTEPGQGSSSWWTQVEKPGGSDSLFISNVYLVGGEKIEGIPDC
jgi:hypothetical protein